MRRRPGANTSDVNAYRFSVSWPRIFPDGTGQLNQKGLDFYSRLVDELKAVGIEPFATLYHWDLPQALQDKGGWQSRSIAQAFGDYAGTVAKHLSDRVRHFFTINEFKQLADTGHSGIELHIQGKAVRLHIAPGLTLDELAAQSSAAPRDPRPRFGRASHPRHGTSGHEGRAGREHAPRASGDRLARARESCGGCDPCAERPLSRPHAGGPI